MTSGIPLALPPPPGDGGRRGRCLADTDLITSRRFCVGSMGGSARSRAWAMSAVTAGSSSVCGPSSTMWRTRVPLPLRIFLGSDIPAPSAKNRLTQRGNSAIENTNSDARSLGPNAIASAL